MQGSDLLEPMLQPGDWGQPVGLQLAVQDPLSEGEDLERHLSPLEGVDLVLETQARLEEEDLVQAVLAPWEVGDIAQAMLVEEGLLTLNLTWALGQEQEHQVGLSNARSTQKD